ncbi:TPA: anti-sigma factor antagonist [Candidatus Berkelbacteria bacterium]|uniref:STAS domain-containing protein n=1 Tax=Berkelbacteria bacterium GW2011_GWE1_39_12 TaxID=1618337 RepID=A0A0G4B3E8_9BACT|nr:MAG: hypothetical protein UT28_C0001G0290 [Berkelbacteria bacterium GW2011_GWE1_39_12]HBO60685.1 anti-sigma factor antagonist [Candidatus Berkelbacteria bacterium]
MANFGIEISKYLDIPVVTLTGEIDISSLEQMGEKEKEIGNVSAVVFDLSKATYCDSICVKWIMSWLINHNVNRLIVVVSPDFRKIFKISEMDKYVALCDDISSAHSLLEKYKQFEKLEQPPSPWHN